MAWPPFFKTRDADAFLGAVRAVLEESTNWRLHNFGRLADARYVNAEYVGSSFNGTELCFALCCFDDRPDKIQLTLHAKNWPSDRTLATDCEYDEAERLTAPLFRDASKVIGSPTRLSRPRRKKSLVGKLAKSFDGFLLRTRDCWNPGKRLPLHQRELEAVFDFTSTAHRLSSRLQEGELAAALRVAGFDADAIAELCSNYVTGRRILAVHVFGRRRTDVDVWSPWNARDDRKRAKLRRKRESKAL